MNIDYPRMLPSDFTAPDYPFDLTTNHSCESSAAVRSGALLFRFYNFSDEVRITVELFDANGNGSLGPPAIVTARQNGGTQLARFSDIGQINTCRYRIVTANQRNARDGAHLGVQIYTPRR